MHALRSFPGSQRLHVCRHFLDVLCVEYEPGAARTLRRVYRRVAPAIYLLDCLAVFMQAAIVGMIYTNSTSQQLFLLAVNIHTNASITIPLSHLLPHRVRYTSPLLPLTVTLPACGLPSLTLQVSRLFLASCKAAMSISACKWSPAPATSFTATSVPRGMTAIRMDVSILPRL